MKEINNDEKFIKSQFYPENSKNRIKEQILVNNDLYIITLDDINKWKLFSGGKKVAESKDHNKIYERIPNK